MRPDDLEFLIAQYADGSLDPRRVEELEAVLRRDAEARALLASYRAVDAALAGVLDRQPAPEVQWDQLESMIRGQVSALSAADPLTDEAEEELSRLSAGDVSADQRVLIEAKLSTDPAARLVLAEYASLDRAFEAVRATPLPAVRWDAFAAHLSRAVAATAEDARAAADGADVAARTIKLVPASTDNAASAREERPAVLGRIGRFFAQPRRLAVAACLLVAASVSVRLAMHSGGPGPIGPGVTEQPPQVAKQPAPPVPPVPPSSFADVRVGPGSNAAPGSAVAEVRLGPPPGVDPAVVSEALRDDVVSRPPSAMIASEKAAVQDRADKKNAADRTALFPR